MGPAPLQSVSPLLNRRPAGRSRLPGILWPFGDTTRSSPVKSRPSQAHSGSALRFSQPLSGFLARSSFAALFRAATARTFPSELVPHRNRVRLSASLAPLQLSTGVLSRTCQAFHQPFHPPPRRSAAARIPDSLWVTFPPARERTHFPVSLSHVRRIRLCSASFAYFGALLLL